MSGRSVSEAELRAALLKLIHRATTHCELRSPSDVALLAAAYANVVDPGRAALRGDTHD